MDTRGVNRPSDAVVVTAPITAADLERMQALLLFGLGAMPLSRHIMATFHDPQRARRWLAQLAPTVTNAGPTWKSATSKVATQIAFTSDGLAFLGLPRADLATFGQSFAEGMCTDHRSRLLGDVGAQAPERWSWGGLTNPVHALVVAFAETEPTLAVHAGHLTDSMVRAGMRVVRELATYVPDDSREHFGFTDGISQPVLRGAPPIRTASDAQWSMVDPGEFVIGIADSTTRSLGALGSFLVVRELHQDVAELRRFEERVGRPVIEKMVGRRTDGTPLAGDGGASNDFGYANSDPDGERCPIGAHIRRANPRDGRRDSPADTLDSTKRHRLLRRGRSFGPPLRPGLLDDGEERGLLFACLNADLVRQFEFVQHHWLNSPLFAAPGESDPLLGRRDGDGPNTFTMPADPARMRVAGLQQFVTMRGGAYFFLPSIPLLYHLAGRTTDDGRGSFPRSAL